MFLKPFRIKSNSKCGENDKQQLKRDIVSMYSSLSQEQVDDLIPDAKPLHVIRLVTYGGVVVTTYHVEREPMFFEHQDKLVPSVYSLWKHPHMLRRVVIDIPAMSRLKNGADLLLSGLNVSEKDRGLKLNGIEKEEYVSVLSRDSGSECSGIAMSVKCYEEMRKSSMTGRGFQVLHTQGDLLWEMGSMIMPVRATPFRTSPLERRKAKQDSRQVSRQTDNPMAKLFDSAMPGSLQHLKDMLIPPTQPFADNKEEVFRVMKEVAIKCNELPVSGRKMAVLLALEEKAKEMGIIPDSSTFVKEESVPSVMTKPSYRADREALESLSANPTNLKYRSAQRLLDEIEDDVDEIGVSLPDNYEHSGEVNEAQENVEENRAEEKKDEGNWQSVNEMSRKAKKKSRPKKSGSAKEKHDGKGTETQDEKLVMEDKQAPKGRKLAIEEYEDHLRKVEEKMRESGKDLSETEGGGGLSAMLAEFRRNLLGSDPSQKLASEREEYSARKEDLTSVWIAGGKGDVVSDKGCGAEGKGAELPGIDQDLYDEERSDEDEVEDDEGEEEGAESLEVGVAKSWYSISETTGGTSGGGVVSEVDEVQAMDDLLRECFFLGIKSVKSQSVSLPLLTSTLYRVHMVEACPQDLRLDVKKSSYKKLSKFLSAMQSQGVISVKETDKGVDVISEIDYRHPLVKNFSPSVVSTKSETATAVAPEIKTIKITQLYSPSHRQVVMFTLLNYNKSSLLEYSQVREALMKYVKDNNLADPDNMACVIPDPTLTDAMGPTGPSFVKGIMRSDLIKLVIDQMKPAYSIMYGQAPPVVRRGNLEPVRLTLAQRMGNKKVTLVENLSVYGIPASDVAHSLQKIAAASTTVTDVPGHSSARQVLVQGNAIKTVVKLLEESYGLPTKHIEAINKIKPPKATKKKKKRK